MNKGKTTSGDGEFKNEDSVNNTSSVQQQMSSAYNKPSSVSRNSPVLIPSTTSISANIPSAGSKRGFDDANYRCRFTDKESASSNPSFMEYSSFIAPSQLEI